MKKPNAKSASNDNNANNDNEVDIGKNSAKKYAKMVSLALLACVILVGSLMFAINRLSLSLFYVSGDSMEPTFNNGDVAVLKYQEYIANGQTVFFRNPSKWGELTPGINDRTIFVKNVTASPYDTILINQEGLFVNDEKRVDFVKEDYECKTIEESGEPYEHTLNLSQIFVTGDNPTKSLDSLRVFCEMGPKKAYLASLEVMQHGDVIKVF